MKVVIVIEEKDQRVPLAEIERLLTAEDTLTVVHERTTLVTVTDTRLPPRC